MHPSTGNRRDLRSLWACLALGGVAYALVTAAAWFTQPAIIFRTGGLDAAPPSLPGLSTVAIPTPDGLILHAWWHEAPAATRTILFFQGNAHRPQDYRARLQTFRNLAAHALIFDYRGFGQSPGRIRREEEIYADGLAAWDYLVRARHIRPRDIVLWGRSLGGAVAAEVARRRPAAALVLESSFFSLEEMGRRHYAWLPTAGLLRFHFRTGDKLPDIRIPVLVIHGLRDDFVPFSQGAKLYQAAREPKALVSAAGGHTDLFDLEPATRVRVAAALERLAATGAADSPGISSGATVGRRDRIPGGGRRHAAAGIAAPGNVH